MVLVGALIVLAAASVGLALVVEPIPSWYYQLAWWSYIVGLDDVNRRLSGRSLLRDRPAHFAWLCAVSVGWWTLFEALNLRLGNWYYVMSHPDRPTRWLSGVVAFATVLPGIVETLALVEHQGWPRSLRVRPLRWGPAADRALVALGVLFFVLPLLLTNVFFPLTWGSFVLLLEPWNRRHARRSFLRDLQEGEAAPMVRTLMAGLVCGVLWETWNYWARSKWIYTVPFFDEWKLFEMPLLGFLGFPPFALECLVVVRALSAAGERLRARWGRAWRPAMVGAAVAATGATAIVFEAADRVTVDSFYVPLERLDVLPEEARRRLVEAGFRSPEQALAAAPAALRAPPLALVSYRGLGQERARALGRLGIHEVADLAAWTPAALADALKTPDPRDRFLRRRAGVWVRGAGWER
ncbi:MAG TPA: hypothetical protein VF310_13340 [Vicinamibacteria bacterium]